MPARPQPPHSADDGAVAVLARRLLDDVRRKSGIRHDRPLERKLCRILASMPLDVLEPWVGTVEAAPPDSPDWLSFIENLTIHETYFFRDIPHHAHLRAAVLPAIVAARRGRGERTLRLWSAGCATGEEAYSLAIVALEALADLGEAERTGHGVVTAWTLDVLGTDLSRLAVVQARNACYGGDGLGPFRDLPPEYAGWFVPLDGAEAGYRRVRADARRAVRFRQHNLMLPAPPETGFDLVSCRNVLIYFDADSRHAAQRQLVAGLAPGGWLVLGTTDRPLAPQRFEKCRGERALAYRLAAAA
ncbi:MAG TPA: CheR family methyltransferase [Azospirillum sp.]